MAEVGELFSARVRDKFGLRDKLAVVKAPGEVAQKISESGRVGGDFLGGRVVRKRSTAQDGVESVPMNKLHRVKVNAVVLTDSEDRHDVGMMQPRRGEGLAAEALETRQVVGVTREDGLERDVPAQRFVNRFIDDPHSASPDLCSRM